MGAGDLREWQRRQRYTDREAAGRLGLSLTQLWRLKNGRSPISRRTELLAAYAVIYDRSWLDVAEAALKLSALQRAAR